MGYDADKFLTTHAITVTANSQRRYVVPQSGTLSFLGHLKTVYFHSFKWYQGAQKRGAPLNRTRKCELPEFTVIGGKIAEYHYSAVK